MIKKIVLFYISFSSIIYTQEKKDYVDIYELLTQLTKKRSYDFIALDKPDIKRKIKQSLLKKNLVEILPELFHQTSFTHKIDTEKKRLTIKDLGYSYLEGTVYDSKTGEPLPYVRVLIQKPDKKEYTNAQGKFFIRTRFTKKDKIIFSCIGYKKKEFDFQGFLDQSTVIYLNEEVFTSEEVLVNQSLSDMIDIENLVNGVGVSPISFRILPNVAQDPIQTLYNIPGLEGTSEGRSGLSFHGGSPDHNLILYNDITLYHHEHLNGFISGFNSENLKYIQFRKNAYNTKYGDRLDGVVEVNSRVGSRKNTSITLNTLFTSLVHENNLNNNISYLISMRKSNKNIFNSTLDNNIKNFTGSYHFDRLRISRDISDYSPDYDFLDTYFKLNLFIDLENIINLNYYYAYDTNLNKSGTYRFSFDNDMRNNGISLSWLSSSFKPFITTVSTSYSKYSFKNKETWRENTASYKQALNNEIEDISINLDNEIQLTNNTAINFGLNFNRIKSSYDLSQSFAKNYLSNYKAKTDKTALFTMFEYNGKKINLKSGLRLINNRLTDENILSHRHSLSFYTGENSDFNFYYSKNYQFISRLNDRDFLTVFDNVWTVSDNEKLDRSSSEKYGFILNFHPENLFLSIEMYEKYIDKLHYPRFFNLANLETDHFLYGDTKIFGFDLTSIVTGLDIPFQFTYSYLADIRNIFHNNSFEEEEFHKHHFKYIGSISADKLTISAIYNISLVKYSFSKRFKSDFDVFIADIKPYDNIDIRISYQPKIFDKKAQLQFTVYNLYDRKNKENTEIEYKFERLSTKSVSIIERSFDFQIKVNI